MNVFVRAMLFVVIVAVIVFGLLLFVRETNPPCPEGQVPALTDDKWVCVVRGAP